MTAIEYRRDALPAPKSLAENLLFMAGLLGTLYKAEEAAAQVSGDVPAVVREAQQSANNTAGRRASRGSRQGFLLTSEERQAIELRAALLAT
ncbi:hypothetical protein OG711_21605 [Streptomyces uncialis]|uniref:hypothetical protein n=1 Tax=Streptomyces uncialis TaxID=1048205 RepID=UPI002E3281FF|nr:hypothetical protein [Streptomyces uncialis]